MKMGLFAANYGTCGDPAIAVRVARAAEAAGFESVWTGEHIVLPDPIVPGSPLPPETPLLDTVVALTLIAANTSRLLVGSGIIVLPQRNPLVLAKELASIDVVSGGRLIVGVGAGYLEPEFEALGIPFERRGKRMDDYIRALRAIWTTERARFDGEFASFANVTAHPRPLQQPGPPIIIGGESGAALRRAVTLGNGWYGFALTPKQAKEAIEGLRRAAERHERPAELGDLEISVTPIDGFDRRRVEKYATLGVDRLIVLPRPGATQETKHRAVPVDEILRNIELVSETVNGVMGTRQSFAHSPPASRPEAAGPQRRQASGAVDLRGRCRGGNSRAEPPAATETQPQRDLIRAITSGAESTPTRLM